MSGEYATLNLERPNPDVLLIVMNRPDAANAINTQMARDFLDVFSRLLAGDLTARCVVLTGAGRRAFCAGGDLKERNGMTDAQWLHQHEIVERALFLLADFEAPVVAAVNGAAFGGGCELALAADFAYASREARFALTETSLGIMPGAGGTQNLPRAVGLRRASEIIFSAAPFSAQDAFDWGVVNRLFAPDEVLESALKIAERIAANAPLAIRQAKKSMRMGADVCRRTALQIEIEAYHRLVATEDRREGVRAFNEKRKPNFEGR